MSNSIYNYDSEKPIGIIYTNCCSHGDCCDSEKIIEKVNNHTTKSINDLHTELKDTDINKAVETIIARIETSQTNINSNITQSKNEINDNKYT